MRSSLKLGAWALTLFAIAAQAQQYTTTTLPNCGKYSTFQFPDGTYSCERYAIFPWFAAGQGWQSQVSMFVSPVPRVGGVVRGALVTLGIGPGATGANLFGGTFGNYGAIFGQADALLASAGTARLDLIDSISCVVVGGCYYDGNLAVGPLWLIIDAPDVQTLEAATTQLIFLYADATNVLSRQVAVPPVFQDQASPHWASSFSETPTGQAATTNDNFMSFAVTNLSVVAQSVNVALYDQTGTLVAQKNTPVLAAGSTGDAYLGCGAQCANQLIPGGVYADTFASFFGLTAASVSGDAAAATARTGTIDGTLVLRSSGGQPIAPLVVRTVGASVTLLLSVPLP